MKRVSKGDRAVSIVFYVILTALSLLCIYPLWYAAVASVSDSTYVNSGAFILLPRGVHFDAYEYAFTQKQLWIGYRNTLFYTVGGTLFGLGVCLPAGYALSRRDLPCRGLLMGLLVFTMYFSGGLIPTYIVCHTLGLTNTPWILVLLGSVSIYNTILIRTFFSASLPDELREAAFIDGCSNTRFFFTFALPLSKAIIAVIALYIAVAHWNSYYNALVYTTDRNLQPLQMYLRQILLISIDNDDTADPETLVRIRQLVTVVRYAVIVLSCLPIMCLYPFLQKYFVQGVMIGSLKG